MSVKAHETGSATCGLHFELQKWWSCKRKKGIILTKEKSEGCTMTLGDKLTKLRKENNYTQEQLADILEVSRQAISKWENNTAYPETEKLIKLGELYKCSMDYLLKDSVEDFQGAVDKFPDTKSKTVTFALDLNTLYFERKSKRYIHGLPLWHINIGFGRKAKGIIAVGFCARGIVSVGFCSVGLISIGLCSLGFLALGAFAIGLLSAGAISAGILSCGAVSFGVVSVGALAIGHFSVGALALGKYFAMGDHANAMIALGDTEAKGSIYQKIGQRTAQDIAKIKELLDVNIPYYLSWAKNLIKNIL